MLRDFFPHENNAAVQKVTNNILFIFKSGIDLLEPSPYSPCLAPCDLRLISFEDQRKKYVIMFLKRAKNPFLLLSGGFVPLREADFELGFYRWIFSLIKRVEVRGGYVERSKNTCESVEKPFGGHLIRKLQRGVFY